MKANGGNRRPTRSWRIGLLGALLPLTLVSTAQTPTRWQSHPAATGASAAVATSAARYESPAQPMPYRTTLASLRVMPPAQDFDVASFERMAAGLTVGRRVPGLAMAIVQNGRVLSARGYGVTDTSSSQPIDAHTVFRLASLSKSFAATMAGMLVADGSLRWDSKVSDYMPGFHLSDPDATRELTVADVISHRVGLRDHNAFDRDIEGNADYYAVAQKLASAPLGCMPGQCYAYQNVAYSLIGDVIFAATGGFYDQNVERRIFKPLGMNDASIGLAGIEGSPRWARPHVRGRNGWVALMPKPTYYRLQPAAGVNASISDMAQWLIAQTGHRPDVLPAPLLATLHAPVISTPGEMRSGWRHQRVSAAGYALGWRVFEYGGHQVVFHAGAVQGYRGLVAMVPERDLGVAILWNSESPLPSGLLPTILDRAIGLPAQQWLDLPQDDLLMADDDSAAPAAPGGKGKGVSANRATASPQ